MATWDYNSYLTYVLDRNGHYYRAVPSGAVDQSGTLNDNEADNSFEINDSLGPGTYAGYYTVGSDTYVIVHISGSTYHLYGVGDSNVTDAELPSAIQVLPLQQRDPNVHLTTLDPTCFSGGTMILTPSGEIAVEQLRRGDLVTTADGRAVPVKWIGRQSVHKIFTPAERFAPVRIPAGALGDGLPHADLVLTADHALILDGIAVNAGALVDGATIAREPMAALPERVTYYHVETEAHEIILANGVPAETYVDYVARRAFDNHQEYVDLYGAERTIAEMPLPRVSSRRQLPPQLRRRLDGRRIA